MKLNPIYNFLGFCFLLSHTVHASNPILGTNDTCQTALDIVCNDSIDGTTLDKTDTNGVGGPDAFYKYTETGADPRDVTFSLCTAFDYDPYMRIYTNCNLNNPIENDDSCGLGSEITLTAMPGVTYYIAIEGYNGDSGNFTLTLACEGPPMPPPNDDLANAIFIEDVNYLDQNVNFPDATEEGGNPNGCTIDGINGVWYRIPSISDFGRTEASIVSPEGVQAVIFFEAPNNAPTIDQLVHVDQAENPCFTSSEAAIDGVPDTFYFILVANSGNVSDVMFSQAILDITSSTFKNFSFFPNPTSEILTLKNTTEIEKIVLRNMLGVTVVAKEINGTEATIETEHLATGSYILSVYINGVSAQYHVLKK
jgi:hypothetical protein